MDHIYFIGIAQGIFASIFFLTKRSRYPSSLAAGLFMFFLSLPMISNMAGGFLSQGNILLQVLLHAVPFTYGPFLFIYTELVIAEEPHFRKNDLLHFIPFLFFAILLLSGMKIITPGIDTAVSVTGAASAGHKPGITWIIKYALINISYISYTILILLKLHLHKKNIGDYYSNETAEISLTWLFAISILFMLCNTAISLFVIGSSVFYNYSFKPGIFTDYGLTFFIFIFSLFSGKQQNIYSRKHNIYQATDTKRKYLKSGLTEENRFKYQNVLETLMQEEKLFLNSELTIQDVADSLNIKRHHITQLLNLHLKVNFNTYINNYRINYVIDKLKNETPSGQSILDLAMEAGFNSKATFNRLFKDITGTTPSEYKKTAQHQK